MEATAFGKFLRDVVLGHNRLARQPDLELLALDAAGAEELYRAVRAPPGDRHVRKALVNLDLADVAARESARLASERTQDVAGTQLVLAAARDVQRLHGRVGVNGRSRR